MDDTRDPLSRWDRQRLLAAPRPRRSLPLAAREGASAPLAERTHSVDERSIPRHAVWELTLQRDLSCRHAGSRAGHASPGELTTLECLDLIAQMADLGVMEVTLIGGEPYLRPDWLELVRAIRTQGMECGMTSWGHGIDRVRAQSAAEAGLQTVSISLDGIEVTHDLLRRHEGAYRAGLAALVHLREAGVPVAVHTQINRLSTPDLEPLLEVIVAHGVHGWQLMLTVTEGGVDDDPDVLLQPYDLLALFPLLDRLEQRCGEAGVRLWPGNNLGYFGPFESRLRGSRARDLHASSSTGRCTLGIDADGAISGRGSFPDAEWFGGNVRDDSLRTIWERAPLLRDTRDRVVEDLWGFCRDCRYADSCRAGCSRTCFVLFGKTGNNPYCHHRALELDRAGKRERLVPTAFVENQPRDRGAYSLVVEDIP